MLALFMFPFYAVASVVVFAFWIGLAVAIAVDVATRRPVFINTEDESHGDLGKRLHD